MSYITKSWIQTQFQNFATRIAAVFATKTEVDGIKKSVSDGKAEVASAITAKGVTTAADATFATMATNVGKIETCLRWKNTANGTYKFEQNGDRWIANNQGINSSIATSTWKVKVQDATTAYIGWRTATESPDKLRIELNGVAVLDETGGLESSETPITLNLIAGENTLVATYTKDVSTHLYGDIAYVVLPPIGEQPGQYTYQSKTITLGSSAKTVYPDNGYDGMYAVTVGAAGANISSVTYVKSVGANAYYDVPAGHKLYVFLGPSSSSYNTTVPINPSSYSESDLLYSGIACQSAGVYATIFKPSIGGKTVRATNGYSKSILIFD